MVEADGITAGLTGIQIPSPAFYNVAISITIDLTMALLAIDPERQKLAKQYALLRLRLWAVSLTLSLCALLVLGPLGVAPDLRDVVQHLTGAWPLQVAIFFGVLGLVWALLTLPLMYYGGFVLPHRFGQSNQTLRAWAADMVKGAGVGVVLGAIAVETLYGFLRLTPLTWWIWTGIAFTLLTVVLAALAPLVIIPIFFKLRPLRDQALREAILRLAEGAGTQVASVCEIELSAKSPAANAAVIGLGRTRKIVLGDTLLSEFPSEEIEVVVAHELGHHVHRDVGKGLLADSFLAFAGFFLASLVLRAAVGQWHFSGVWDLGAFPVLAVTFGAWSAATGVLSRALSRRMERAADAFSIAITGRAEAFTNSEVRLTNQNLGWFQPPCWVENLFYTHPAPWRRVAMGEEALKEPSSRT